VQEWLDEHYPKYNAAVTASQADKRLEQEIIDSHPYLKVPQPGFSYKRYGYGLSNLVAQKFAYKIGAQYLGFSGRLTNCGMSAIGAVLDALDLDASDKVMIGKVMYSETPKMLKKKGLQIIEVDCSYLEDVQKEFIKNSPKVVMFESVGNGPGMPVFHFCEALKFFWDKDVVFILDNTLLSAVLDNPFFWYEPALKHWWNKPRMKFVYIESLSKFYKTGDEDKVTAGIIVAPEELIKEIDEVIPYGYYLQYPCLANLPWDLLAVAIKILPEVSETALQIYDFLSEHDNVLSVDYCKRPKGGGGVLYFVINTNDAEEAKERMQRGFGSWKGSFGHPKTTYIPFGYFLDKESPGLVRLAIGYKDSYKNIVAKLKESLS